MELFLTYFIEGTNYEKWQEKTLSGKVPIAVCTSVFKHHDPDLPFSVVCTSFLCFYTFLLFFLLLILIQTHAGGSHVV